MYPHRERFEICGIADLASFSKEMLYRYVTDEYLRDHPGAHAARRSL